MSDQRYYGGENERRRRASAYLMGDDETLRYATERGYV